MGRSNTNKFPVGCVVFWAVILAMRVPEVREFVAKEARHVQEMVTEVRKFVGKVAVAVQEAVTPAPSPWDEDASPKANDFGSPTDGKQIFPEGLRSTQPFRFPEGLRSSRPFPPCPSVDLPGESWKIRSSLSPLSAQIDRSASAAAWRTRGLTDPRSAIDARPAVILGRTLDRVEREGGGSSLTSPLILH